MELLRTHIGSVLRDARVSQGRTLRDVAASANISLGYLSEVERGQKEASSELLNAICLALDLSLDPCHGNCPSIHRTSGNPNPHCRRRKRSVDPFEYGIEFREHLSVSALSPSQDSQCSRYDCARIDGREGSLADQHDRNRRSRQSFSCLSL